MDLILFVLALSLLVLVHELGHYLAARLTGVRVEEFGLGLPPKIWGKKIGQTVWSLNWLPIGGFCKLYGEDTTATGRDSFNHKNPFQKGLIVVGGVLMNLVLAIVIFTLVYSILGIPKETDKVKIVGIAPNSPAQVAGLQEDDWVREVEGETVTKSSQLTEKVNQYKGQQVVLFVQTKTGEEKVVLVDVREKPPEGEGSMGVAISNTELIKIKWYQGYLGIGAGFKEALYWGKIITGGVFKMIAGLFSGQLPADVSGPIGMYQATSSIKKTQGLLAVAHFFGVVSVNLAIVNILPFPALDGGRIIFVLYELIFRKKANQKFEAWVNQAGMLILLSLIFLITASDVLRLIKR